MKRLFAVEIVPSVYVLVLGYAAVSKLLDFEDFQIQLSQSRLLTSYAGILVWFLPAAEILICILLVIPRSRLIALEGAFLLMAMFSVYIFAITRFTDNPPCSCGGVLERLSWDQHLLLNLVLLFANGLSILWYPAGNQHASRTNGISG